MSTGNTEKKLTLAEKLVLAQLDMKHPVMDGTNPHFQSKYATLSSVRREIDRALKQYGVVVNEKVTTTTCTESTYFLIIFSATDGNESLALGSYPLKLSKPQDMGSQITYARRYFLAPYFGLVAEPDDDGERTRVAAEREEQERILQERSEAITKVAQFVDDYNVIVHEADTIGELEGAMKKLKSARKKVSQMDLRTEGEKLISAIDTLIVSCDERITALKSEADQTE